MNKHALCIGINDYPGTGMDLAGCVNDADDWSAMLAGRGFAVDRLTDAQATRTAMVNGIRKAIGKAMPGDLVVVTFSGHGTYELDLDGDEAAGFDQALCPYDLETKGQALVDAGNFGDAVAALEASAAFYPGEPQYADRLALLYETRLAGRPGAGGHGACRAPHGRAMNVEEYARMYEAEETQWWYAGMRAISSGVRLRRSGARASLPNISVHISRISRIGRCPPITNGPARAPISGLSPSTPTR